MNKNRIVELVLIAWLVVSVLVLILGAGQIGGWLIEVFK